MGKRLIQDILTRDFRGKIQSAALNQFVYVSVLWIFYALGDDPEKWHIFLFSVAYSPSYWHMPFERSTTIYHSP